jgi:cytochrome c oxidase cbb3-type subunit 4
MDLDQEMIMTITGYAKFFLLLFVFIVFYSYAYSIYKRDRSGERDFEKYSQLVLDDSIDSEPLETRGVKIKSFELSESLRMNNSGTKILTRDTKKMKTKSIDDDKKILVGTYIFTQKQLILFLKLINLHNGNIIATNTLSTRITNEIKDLEGINTNTDPVIYTPFHL